MCNVFLAIFITVILFPVSIVNAAEFSFVTFHYPPLEYKKDGKAEGGMVEIVKKIMHNLGHEVTIEVYPWTRGLKMVRFGEADAIFTAYKNSDRERYLLFSEEVLFPQSVYFYKRMGDSSTFDGNFNALGSKRIGVVSTISYGQRFADHKETLLLDRANNLEQSFFKLLKKRVDLVPSEQIVAEYTLAKLGITGEVERLPIMLESVPSYIAFSRKLNLSELRDAFDQELRKMKQRGEYRKLLKKYSIDRRE